MAFTLPKLPRIRAPRAQAKHRPGPGRVHRGTESARKAGEHTRRGTARREARERIPRDPFLPAERPAEPRSAPRPTRSPRERFNEPPKPTPPRPVMGQHHAGRPTRSPRSRFGEMPRVTDMARAYREQGRPAYTPEEHRRREQTAKAEEARYRERASALDRARAEAAAKGERRREAERAARIRERIEAHEAPPRPKIDRSKGRVAGTARMTPPPPAGSARRVSSVGARQPSPLPTDEAKAGFGPWAGGAKAFREESPFSTRKERGGAARSKRIPRMEQDPRAGGPTPPKGGGSPREHPYFRGGGLRKPPPTEGK